MSNEISNYFTELFNDDNPDYVIYQLISCDSEFDLDMSNLIDCVCPRYIDRNLDTYQEQLEAYNTAKKNFFDENGYSIVENVSEDDYFEGVFSFNGRFYRSSWFCNSHEGVDYDRIASSLREVFPKEKTITIYE